MIVLSVGIQQEEKGIIMADPKYKVTLTKEERDYLIKLVKKSSLKSCKTKNAIILLELDSGEYGPKEHKSLVELASFVGVSRTTIYRVQRDFVEESLERALTGRTDQRGHRPAKLDGEHEAKLIMLACSKAPEGHSKWSIRLLADKFVQLYFQEGVSDATVYRILKKTRKNLG